MHHTTGSHHLLKHPDTPHLRVTLPVHHRDLKRRTLESIIEQADLTVEAFQQRLSTYAGIAALGREVHGRAGIGTQHVPNLLGRFRRFNSRGEELTKASIMKSLRHVCVGS
jgi:hypothetical protein